MKPLEEDYATCGGCGVTKYGPLVTVMLWCVKHQMKCKKLKDKVARIRLS